MLTTILESPLGPIRLRIDDDAITELRWKVEDTGDGTDEDVTPSEIALKHPLIAETDRQLRAYFAGDLDVRTYGGVAEELGASARAVGTACGRNPIPIIIPCHRIVAANGKMGGFSAAGGVEDKVWLLRHEGALL